MLHEESNFEAAVSYFSVIRADIPLYGMAVRVTICDTLATV
jgi:hypothetical protein